MPDDWVKTAQESAQIKAREIWTVFAKENAQAKLLEQKRIITFRDETYYLNIAIIQFLEKVAKEQSLVVNKLGIEGYHDAKCFANEEANKFLTREVGGLFSHYFIYSYRYKIVEPVLKKNLYIYVTLNNNCKGRCEIHIQEEIYQFHELEDAVRNWLYHIYLDHFNKLRPK